MLALVRDLWNAVEAQLTRVPRPHYDYPGNQFQGWELKLVLDFEFIITKMRNLKQLKEMEVSDSY